MSFWISKIKSESFSSILEVVAPEGTLASQSPLEFVVTFIIEPKEVKISISTLEIPGSPISWTKLLLTSKYNLPERIPTSYHPSFSVKVFWLIKTFAVLGFVPSVCIAPVGKSGSFIFINTEAEPTDKSFTNQLPLLSVLTTLMTPELEVISTSTLDISDSEVSWVPLPLRS